MCPAVGDAGDPQRNLNIPDYTGIVIDPLDLPDDVCDTGSCDGKSDLWDTSLWDNMGMKSCLQGT